jgi:site-specific DNA recombinase
VEELNRRIARLRKRLKGGDPDLTADELVAIIERAEAKRIELMAAATPEGTRTGNVLHAVPASTAPLRPRGVH